MSLGVTSENTKSRQRTFLMLSLLASFSASWVLPGRLPGSRQRAGVPVACTPFRSDDEFDYFS